MEQVSSPQPLELTVDAAAGPRIAAPRLQTFDLWFLAALLVHGALLFGLLGSKPRQLGDASGMDGAISVSLVSESDLRGEATIDDRAAGEPVPLTAPPQQQPTPTPPTPEPPPQAVSQPPQDPAPAPSQTADAPAPSEPPLPADATTEQPPAEAAQDTAPPPAASEPASTSAAALSPPSEDLVPPAPEAPPKTPEPPKDHPAHNKPAASPAHPKSATTPETKPPPKPVDAKKAEPKPPQPKSWEPKTAKLDLSVPPPSLDVPSGSRGAGVERPAGITRSGENDRFARGVIRALQQTMPQLRDTRGRVRVRITLDRNGNLVKTDVLMPSQIAGLDQSVVFATRQTSFPLPPNNATPADLVFVVTYIYR